ncbi:MAG: hypothetical protein V3U60_16495 [Gammaproteobacteria bacterium]
MANNIIAQLEQVASAHDLRPCECYATNQIARNAIEMHERLQEATKGLIAATKSVTPWLNAPLTMSCQCAIEEAEKALEQTSVSEGAASE